jgi:hypothetical protein
LMALTYLELVQLMADELDYAQPTTLQGNVSPQVRRMKNHVNRAYNYIWLQLNPSLEDSETLSLVQTTAGLDYVVIPSTMNQVDEVQKASEPPLLMMSWPEFQSRRSGYLENLATGSPSYASIYQRQIYLAPTPDAVYTLKIRGKGALTELSADTDTPTLRSDFHRVILEWALYLQMVYENNPMANNQLRIASQVFEMAKDNSRNHRELPPQFGLDLN